MHMELWLPSDAPRELQLQLQREFPSLLVRAAAEPPARAVTSIDAGAWRANPWAIEHFDHIVISGLAPPRCALRVVGDAFAGAAAMQIVTRYQRRLRWRAPDEPCFDRVLRAHRALHDLDKPLVRADYDHALDARAWMLRLNPRATLEAQLAILFHDIERLLSESDARIEQHAADYQSFKDAHAAKGARMAEDVLSSCGVARATCARAAELIANHERPGGDEEASLMNDADALSFFSLNSPGYLRYFGPEQTRRKVRYSLRRLGRSARTRLRGVRLVGEIEAMVREDGEGGGR